jgi:branched-chain amino acid transport system ATP-binding protein
LIANQNIDVDIHQNETIGLIGPNGAGKTTFFNCISGVYKPEEGSIRFDGEDFTSLSPDIICHRTGPSDRRIYKNMTVVENAMIGFC